jgi:hypothetical protein
MPGWARKGLAVPFKGRTFVGADRKASPTCFVAQDQIVFTFKNKMYQRTTRYATAALAFIMLCSGVLNDDGKAGRTGSPGESTCRNCHDSFVLNSGPGSVTLTADNMPGWEYEPGMLYHMNATVAQASRPLFGVGVEALSSSNANAGTLAITNSDTQIKTATVQGQSRNNVVHTFGGGASADSKTFAFDWQAPNSNIGNVTFYFAGVAANDDGENNNDHVYTGTQVVTPAIGTGIDEATATVRFTCFPNPVGSVLRVRYQLPAGNRVRITLHSAGGQLLATLVDADRPAGEQEEVLTGMQRFAPGALIVRMDMGSSIAQQRLVFTGAGN